MCGTRISLAELKVDRTGVTRKVDEMINSKTMEKKNERIKKSIPIMTTRKNDKVLVESLVS